MQSDDDMTEYEEENVYFFSGPALRLAGRIYHPAHRGAEQRPGIVMVHGLGGYKEDNTPPTARRLARAGYRVLTYDFRGGGASDSLGRNRVAPFELVEDAYTALEWFATRDDVDQGRVAFWGSSLGGAIVLGALMCSRSARCAVLVVPAVAQGYAKTDVDPNTPWGKVREKAWEALVRKTRTGVIEQVERNTILTDADTQARYAGKSHAIALESLVHLRAMGPADWAPFIRRPVQMFAVEADLMLPIDKVRAFYERLTCQKALHVFPEGNHYSLYEDLVDETVEVAVRFLEAQLA